MSDFKLWNQTKQDIKQTQTKSDSNYKTETIIVSMNNSAVD